MARTPDADRGPVAGAPTETLNSPTESATHSTAGVRQGGRINWPDVVAHAADIVYSYSTSVTLRQLFYRLVSEQLIPNTTAAYKGLSSKTAEARREMTSPT